MADGFDLIVPTEKEIGNDCFPTEKFKDGLNIVRICP